MKTYEIINPSDKYTMQAEDFHVAAVAVLFLGGGNYGIEGTPILFGWTDWLKEQGIDLDEFVPERATEIAACLDTVLIGDREEAEAALKEIPESRRVTWLAERHDRLRSSINDIGATAKAIARALREKYPATVSQ